jgi:hypothetical protein
MLLTISVVMHKRTPSIYLISVHESLWSLYSWTKADWSHMLCLPLLSDEEICRLLFTVCCQYKSTRLAPWSIRFWKIGLLDLEGTALHNPNHKATPTASAMPTSCGFLWIIGAGKPKYQPIRHVHLKLSRRKSREMCGVRKENAIEKDLVHSQKMSRVAL